MNRPSGTGLQDEDQKPADDISQIVTSTGISAAQSASEKGDPRPTAPGKGKTVALTLGSGGARGYAHIGAIEILVERGYDIVAISGCSMGALIGGVFAAGKMKDYKDWVTGLGQFDVLKLLDVTFSSVGAIRGEEDILRGAGNDRRYPN